MLREVARLDSLVLEELRTGDELVEGAGGRRPEMRATRDEPTLLGSQFGP
jgi:hypothetical protein